MHKIGIFLIAMSLALLGGCSSSKKLSPKDKKAELYYSYGTSNLLEKEYSKALDNLLKAYHLKKEDTKILNNLGMAYYFKKQYKLAENFFINSLLIDKKNSDARNNLASLYFKLGKFDLATKEYNTILQDLVYQHQYRVYYNLALINLRKYKRLEAKQNLRMALHENPHYCPAHFRLGELESENKNYKEAYKHFFEASKGTCVSLPAPHYHQGTTLLAMKKFKKAKLKLEEVTKNFKNSHYKKLASKKLREVNRLIARNRAGLDTEALLDSSNSPSKTDNSIITPVF